mmetsp:Transcript_24091/g.77752  ORF Transcript_24091/g.77752 Transcript_24091/m.77752 type:complete len:263 (+) Transcript_24091:296-1084(+)
MALAAVALALRIGAQKAPRPGDGRAALVAREEARLRHAPQLRLEVCLAPARLAPQPADRQQSTTNEAIIAHAVVARAVQHEVDLLPPVAGAAIDVYDASRLTRRALDVAPAHGASVRLDGNALEVGRRHAGAEPLPEADRHDGVEREQLEPLGAAEGGGVPAQERGVVAFRLEPEEALRALAQVAERRVQQRTGRPSELRLRGVEHASELLSRQREKGPIRGRAQPSPEGVRPVAAKDPAGARRDPILADPRPCRVAAGQIS